jgi:glycogen synthase
MHAHGRMFMMNIHSLKWKGLIIYMYFETVNLCEVLFDDKLY